MVAIRLRSKDLSLEGTWSLEGKNVSLQHEADTVLRDIVLTASDSRLNGEFVEAEGTVRGRLEQAQSND